MLRVRVEYKRTKQVVETGYVTVDVDDFATLKEVYEKAYEQEFSEKLATKEEVTAEDWQFHVKQGQPHEPAPAPKPA